MNQNHPERIEKVVCIDGVTFSHKDLLVVIDDFYSRIQLDPILSIPFRSVGDWPEHIERLTHFWWVRFGGKPYQFGHYSPVTKHFFAGFNRALLARWLHIFDQTLQTHLTKEQSNLWKKVADQMGEALAIKNEIFGKSYESRQQRLGKDGGLSSGSDKPV